MSKKLENIIIDGDVRNVFTAYYSKEDAKQTIIVNYTDLRLKSYHAIVLNYMLKILTHCTF